MGALEWRIDKGEFEQMLTGLLAREPDLVVKAAEDFDAAGVRDQTRALFHYLFETTEGGASRADNRIVLRVRDPKQRAAALRAFLVDLENVSHDSTPNAP